MNKMESFSISESDEVTSQRAEIERLADELYSTLVTNYEPRKLKESIFAGFFLPRILNEIKDDNNVWISMWKDVAGTAAAPVDVVSDSNGEVLFRVPPLIQSSKLGVRGNPFSLKDVIQQYNMLKDNPIKNSKGYINAKLSETLGEVASGVDLSEEISQWESILKRYGRLEGGDKNEASTTNPDYDEDPSDLIIW